MIKITAQHLSIFALATGANASQMVAPIQSAMDKYDISKSAKRVAAFLANIGVESDGLQMKRENLSYSALRMCQVWPSRYAINSRAKPLQPNSLAISLQFNPQKLGNNVYANRLGNGDEASGDGYKYRGGFFIQTTGKTNYQQVFKEIGIYEGSDPDSVTTNPNYCALAAAYFFSVNGCNELADKGEISNIVRVINGSLPSPANQGPRRISLYNDAVKALS